MYIDGRSTLSKRHAFPATTCFATRVLRCSIAKAKWPPTLIFPFLLVACANFKYRYLNTRIKLSRRHSIYIYIYIYIMSRSVFDIVFNATSIIVTIVWPTFIEKEHSWPIRKNVRYIYIYATLIYINITRQLVYIYTATTIQRVSVFMYVCI